MSGRPTGSAASPMHALETGALSVADFEQALARRLRAVGGRPLATVGLLSQMMSNFRYDADMLAAVRMAHRQGIAQAASKAPTLAAAGRQRPTPN